MSDKGSDYNRISKKLDKQIYIPSDELFLPDIHTYKNGEINYKCTLDNLKAIVEYKRVTLYYDEILKIPIVELPGGESLLTKDPDQINSLSIEIANFGEKNNFIGFNSDKIYKQLVHLSYQSSRNIPKEKLYLAKLEYPDSKGEIDKLIDCFTFKDDNPIYPILITKWLNQVTAMICNDQGKYGAEAVLVLQGKQAIGKSYFGRLICSYFGDEYFMQNIRFNTYGNVDKDVIIKATGCVIGELAEFETNPRMMDLLKEFITAGFDTVRKPYGKAQERFNRLSTFYATTNRDYFLNDSENRRFWIVPVKYIDTERIKNEINHKRLWAEAYLNFLENGRDSFKLTVAERLTAESISKARIKMTPEDIAIRDWLDWTADINDWRWQTATQIAENVGLPATANRNVGYALTKIGYSEDSDTYRKKNTNQGSRYLVPQSLYIHRF